MSLFNQHNPLPNLEEEAHSSRSMASSVASSVALTPAGRTISPFALSSSSSRGSGSSVAGLADVVATADAVQGGDQTRPTSVSTASYVSEDGIALTALFASDRSVASQVSVEAARESSSAPNVSCVLSGSGSELDVTNDRAVGSPRNNIEPSAAERVSVSGGGTNSSDIESNSLAATAVTRTTRASPASASVQDPPLADEEEPEARSLVSVSHSTSERGI